MARAHRTAVARHVADVHRFGRLLRPVVTHVLGPESAIPAVSALAHVASYGAVRGIISGLGLLNLWYALQDVLRHREG